MNKQINKAAEDMLKQAQNAEMPKAVKDMVLEGVNKSQDANVQFTAFLKDAGKTYEGLVAKAVASTRAINDKMLDNAASNAKAALDHAAKVVKSGDLKTATEAQAEFAREQFGVLSDQQIELMDLTGNVAREMFDASADVANAAAEKVKAAV
ncbi:MAG: phasin family protein [Pseudomonadota bacterium]